MTPKEAATSVIQTCLSDGWTQVIAPGLERRRQGLINEILKAPGIAPTAQVAGIQVIDYMLKLPQQAQMTLKEIEEADRNEAVSIRPPSGSPYSDEE